VLWYRLRTRLEIKALVTQSKLSWTVKLVSVLVVVAALYLAKGLLAPLTLAVLLSFLLSPVCGWLERRKIGRIPAVLVTASLGFTLLAAVAWMAFVQIANLAPKIPEYQTNIEARLSTVNSYAASAINQFARSFQGLSQDLPLSDQGIDGTQARPYSVRIIASPTSPIQIFGGMFGTLLEGFGTTGVVIVLVVFFLIRREDLRDRFIHLVGQSHVTVTTQTLEDAASRISRYLSVLFFLNLTFGISVGLGLYLIGIPNASLWGISAGLFRFIPYLGPWISAAAPVGLSLAISTGWEMPLFTLGLFVGLELLNNNFLEPWLYGKNTGVSAVAVLLAAVFWMWLWGTVGLLIAMPMTVCLLVIGKHVPQLSFLNILLGNEPVFEPKTRVYQRLLAGDLDEATELFEGYLAEQTLVEVYDNILIPALSMAEIHWHLDKVDERHHNFILQGMHEIIQIHYESQQELQAEKPSEPTSTTDSPNFVILCIPARSEADAISSNMLAQILDTQGCLVQAIPATSLESALLEIIGQRHADVVCISATPPAAAMHARHLCQLLRTRFPSLTIVVGLWDSHVDIGKTQDRIGCGVTIVATLANAQKLIRQLIPPISISDA